MTSRRTPDDWCHRRCKTDPPESNYPFVTWAKRRIMIKRVAAIALANKTVRTAFALIKNKTEYCPSSLVV